MAHSEWLSGVRLRHFSTTFVEYCESWCLSNDHSSVALAVQALCLILSNCQFFIFNFFTTACSLLRNWILAWAYLGSCSPRPLRAWIMWLGLSHQCSITELLMTTGQSPSLTILYMYCGTVTYFIIPTNTGAGECGILGLPARGCGHLKGGWDPVQATADKREL